MCGVQCFCCLAVRKNTIEIYGDGAGASENLVLIEAATVDGSKIEEAGLNSLTELSAYVPNLTVTENAVNTIIGSPYVDAINPGLGADVVTGGSGVDYINVTETTSSRDIVVLGDSVDASNYDGSDYVRGCFALTADSRLYYNSVTSKTSGDSNHRSICKGTKTFSIYRVTGYTDCATYNCLVQTSNRLFHQSADCANCVTGQYADQLAQGICKRCVAGLFADQTARTAVSDCKNCPKGFWISNTGNNGCTPCIIGKWKDVEAQVSDTCISCLSGKYNTLTGSPSVARCIDCEKGKYMVPSITASSTEADCTTCEKSKYADQTGVTVCKKCVAGTYGDTAGLIAVTLCKSCSTGKFSTEEALLTNAQCIFCPKGYVQTIVRQTLCNKCVTGQYGDETGIVSALHTDSILPKCKAVSFVSFFLFIYFIF